MADPFATPDPLDRLTEAHRRGTNPDTIAELTRHYQHHEARMLRRLDQYLTLVTRWAVRSGQMTQDEADQVLADCGHGTYPDPPPRPNPLLDPEFRRRHGIVEVTGDA